MLIAVLFLFSFKKTFELKNTNIKVQINLNMFMNISSFIVKASSERSVKSLGCLIPMIIGRVPRLSRRNK
jgi:hypothetical protein